MEQEISKMSPQELRSFISSVKNAGEVLKEKGEDLLATFLINNQLLDISLEKYCSNNEHILKIKALINKLKEFEETSTDYFQQHLSLSEEILRYKNEIEDQQYIHEIEVSDLGRKNSALAKLWSNKEKQITALRESTTNNYNTASMQKRSILIYAFTWQTLLVHNELEMTRDVVEKFNKKMIKEKKKQNILIDYNHKLKVKNKKLKSLLRNCMSKNSTIALEEAKNILEDSIEEPINVISEQRRADTSINIQTKIEEDILEFHKTTQDKSEAKRPITIIKQNIPKLELVEKHPQSIEQSPPVRKKIPETGILEEASFQEVRRYVKK
jgi:hypothetical protein